MTFYSSTGRDITHANVKVVPCTKVSVDIFDPVYSSGILHPSGNIVKCYHEIYPDFDELRRVCSVLSFCIITDVPKCNWNVSKCLFNLRWTCFLTAFAWRRFWQLSHNQSKWSSGVFVQTIQAYGLRWWTLPIWRCHWSLHWDSKNYVQRISQVRILQTLCRMTYIYVSFFISHTN